jgi:hypothetical protein
MLELKVFRVRVEGLGVMVEGRIWGLGCKVEFTVGFMIRGLRFGISALRLRV